MSQDAIISKVSIIVTFSHIKDEVAKFDLAVKYVNINTRFSFEQNIMSLNLHTKFHRNRPTGSWKQDFFLNIYTIYGHGSHLGHVTSIIINFHFLVPQNYIHNLAENDPVVPEKCKF